MNIELYIDNQLCDLEKSDLGIRLKRQFFNPKELSTKDVQKSYSLTLPATARNNEIFRHKNVEETVGKFTFYPDARLYVNGLLIMEGKFRLSEISAEGYKGNLGVPTPLTAKDVFGERKMNDMPEWVLEDFEGEKSISQYNVKGDTPSPCIFPLVLYGRVPGTDDTGTTSINNAKFALTDFPASINCMHMLQHFFGKADYTLNGTALEDERLKNLYVSYRNPEDYPIPFEVQKAGFKGEWSNWKEKTSNKQSVNREFQVSINDRRPIEDDGQKIVACNLFRCNNMTITPGSLKNTTHQMEVTIDNQVKYKVPKTGLYKIYLDVTTKYPDLGREYAWPPVWSLFPHNYETDVIANRKATGTARSFKNRACEIQLLRHQKEDFDLREARFENIFNNDDPEGYPKPKNTHFISRDTAPNLLCGFALGQTTWDQGNNHWNNINHGSEGRRSWLFINRVPLADGDWCNPLAIKHEKKISESGEDTDEQTLSVVSSPGYYKKDPEDDTKLMPTSRYKIDLQRSNNQPTLAQTNLSKDGEEEYFTATGQIEQIVELKAGEYISLIASQDKSDKGNWVYQTIDFEWWIEPFNIESPYEWMKINDKGNSTEILYWDADKDYVKNKIDLVKFMPTEVKIDDWISNFCKAFNLKLTHKGGKIFELNVNDRNVVHQTSHIIDLDGKANVTQSTNESLALPRAYKLGYTIDTSETGYYESLKKGENNTDQKAINEGDTGGGLYETGSEDANTIEQKSNFSYCWYRKIGAKREVPIIADRQIWDGSKDYLEVKDMRSYNKAQRFWFHSSETQKCIVHDEPNVDIALVSEQSPTGRPLYLNYEDKPNSIMHEYFTLLTNDKEYTCVECYLTPQEYDLLEKAYVRYNGDLYNVADVDGFDPMGREKTKLKLIKKI